MKRKILGIGLQRTGTTSLYHAFKALGINAAPQAIPLFYNLQDDILQQYEAFADNPIPLIYQQLDKKNPGCKFILTTRSKSAWLKSVQWLFEEELKRLPKKLQDVANEIHKKFYGVKNFDSDIFSSKWDAYHAEVEQYFKGREEDLLLMDFEKQVLWKPLCTFLNKTIPEEPFPFKNKATRPLS